MVKRSIFGCLILFVFLLLTGCKNDNSAKKNLVEVKDVKMTGVITEIWFSSDKWKISKYEQH
jgi:uncharacterized lipoprotein NlpE involved in copper resistance